MPLMWKRYHKLEVKLNVTIKDIAKHAGVGLSTVSRAINNSGYVSEETKNKIEKAIVELNYIPNIFAKNLPTGGSNVVGVVIPDINNPFFGKIIKGIASVLDNANLYMILSDTDENIKKELKSLAMLRGQMIKGLLITPTSDKNKFNSEYLRLLETKGIPIVLIDRDVKGSKFDGVFLDNVKGAYEATEALIKEGHEKIAIITGLLTSKPGRDRLKGYKKALKINNIEVDKSLILKGDFKEKSGYDLTNKILKLENRPTAIFTSNNLMTLGSIRSLIENNIKIGEKMSLIGFDEIEILNSLSLNISVVSRPTKEMGRIASEILLERLNYKKNNDKIKRVILSPKLLLKGSEKIKS